MRKCSMSANNMSRSNFKAFCVKNNYEKLGARNVFVKNGKRFVYIEGNSIRQFYDDCDGAYVNGKFYSKSQLNVLGCSRISPTGIVAYNATIKKEFIGI